MEIRPSPGGDKNLLIIFFNEMARLLPWMSRSGTLPSLTLHVSPTREFSSIAVHTGKPPPPRLSPYPFYT